MCVVVEVKAFLRHILQRKPFVEHTATQTQMIRRFCQEARSTEHRQACTFQSYVCEPSDLQSPHQQYLGTSCECFQLVSERAKERVAVGRKTTALGVSCDTAESLPLASFFAPFSEF